MMRSARTIALLALIVIVVSQFVLLAGASDKKKERRRRLVTGTGSFFTEVTRTTEPLEPPCVTLLTRAGNVQFSGFIENALADGWQEVRGLRDACTEPVQGTARAKYTLKDATVAGRTGDLILEAKGFFEGDAASAEGARPRFHLTIRGVSGELKGATGTAQNLGQAGTTSAFDTYYAEIWLPDR